MQNNKQNWDITNDIEDQLIAALIDQPEDQSLILAKIKIDNFANENNRIIFRLIQNLANRNESIDLVKIHTQLEYEDIDNKAEILSHLLTNIQSQGYVDNLKDKINILINRSTKQKTDWLAKKIIDSKINYLNPEEEFDAWTSELDEIINSRNVGELELIKNFVDDYQKKILNLSENQNQLTGITSGFNDIDKITNGFQNGDLVILAARPSMGKTALAINFLLNASYTLDPSSEGVVFFSLEMSTEQIIQRMITILAKISNQKIKNGELNREDIKVINVNLEKLKKLPIYIEDKANMNILQIESRIRQLIQQTKVKLVVIDYLQLIESTSNSFNRVQEVGKISRKLKIMARELNVPIIAIAQLSRKIEERKAEDRTPMLSDLRESGSIEQDADLVTFIDYERNQYSKQMSQNNPAILNNHRVDVVFYIEKNRNGMTGRVKLHFNKSEGRFMNYQSVINK